MTEKSSLRPKLDSPLHTVSEPPIFQGEQDALTLRSRSNADLPSAFPSLEIDFGVPRKTEGEVEVGPSMSREIAEGKRANPTAVSDRMTGAPANESSVLGISLQLVRLAGEGALAEMREKPLTTAALLVGGTALGLAAAATFPVWATSALATAGLGYLGYSAYNGIRSNSVAVSTLWHGRDRDPVRYDAAEEQLRHALGPVAIDSAAGLLFGGAWRLARVFRPATIGIAGASEKGSVGLKNLINPPINGVSRMDNCIACTGAILTNKLERRAFSDGIVDAHTIERLYGYTGKERALNINQALTYLERVTGVPMSTRQMPFMDPNVPAGDYAIFWGRRPNYVHVTYGQVLPNGDRYIFDGQLGGRKRTWEEMVQRYGGGHARLVEVDRAGRR